MHDPPSGIRHDDWVVDNLLNPASIGPLLTIPDAIAALGDGFEFYAASPHYCTDWRWYKSLTRQTTGYNERGATQYWENAHNLLDYRHLFAPRAARDNQTLYAQCDAIRDLIRTYEASRDSIVVASIRRMLTDVEHSVRAFGDDTADAVRDATTLLDRVPPDAAAVAASRRFGSWFGRGQQYVSLNRVPQPIT